MSNGHVKSEIKNGIAEVTFFHPQSNSLPGTILNQLASAIEAAGKNKDAKVILLRSEGQKTFCAGASFDELIAINTLEEGKTFFSGFATVINTIRLAPKFVVARVQGKAVGGGVGLACAADYALAVDSASTKLSELAVGIGPFVVGPAVERKIGTAAFSLMSINATEWQTAQWSREKGMYAEVYPDIESMDTAIESLLSKLATSNPDAMLALKKVFWEGTDHWNTLLHQRAGISGELVLSEFTRTAIAKFKQR